MILGVKTYIDEIIKKYESQTSIGPRTISIQSPTMLPQAAASPFAAHAEIHSEREGSELSLQTANHIDTDPLRERVSCNL